MSEDNHVLEHLPAYALGALDEAEARLVSAHLAGCHLCRAELAAFQATADQLALAAPHALPSDDLKRRLEERIRSLPGAQPSAPARTALLRRLVPLAGLAGVLLVLALLAANWLLWQRVERLEVLVAPEGMRAVNLHNSGLAPAAAAFLIISADGRNGVLVVDRLPPLDPQQTYQLWLERDGSETSAAVFSVDANGYRGVRVVAPQSLLLYSSVRVTIEPAGGSASPGGQAVLDGSLFNH